MIRFLGILTGSAIALAVLIVTVGVPEFSPRPPPQTFAPEPDFAVQPLPLPEQEEAAIAPENPETIAEPAPIESPVMAEEMGQAALQEPAESAEEPPPAAELGWYAFWSPFRSEIAADGFVTELQRTTGLDYRVVRLKPGVYEVAFAYSDEDDIQEKLARISTATGLDMSGG